MYLRTFNVCSVCSVWVLTRLERAVLRYDRVKLRGSKSCCFVVVVVFFFNTKDKIEFKF